MTRKEYFGKAWVHIKDKLPPDTLDDVLIWLVHLKRPVIVPSWLARKQIKDMEDGVVEFVTGRIFDHWVSIAPPTKHQKRG